MESLSRRVKPVLPYLILGLVIMATTVLVFKLWDASLATLPLSYKPGDSAMTLFRSFEMRNGSGLFNLPNLSGTSGSNTYSFYSIDLLLLVWQWFLSAVTGNFVLGYNLFVLSSFLFVGFSSLYSLKRLGMSNRIAFALSLLYTFLPYHSFRLFEHSYLGFYFLVPLACVFALEIYKGTFEGSIDCIKVSKKRYISNSICLILLGFTGIYYAFFACFIFLVAGICLSSNSGKISSIRVALASILKTIIGVVISAIPMLTHMSQAGVERSGFGAEVYSMRLSQLLLPITNHRISLIASLKEKYNGLIQANENDWSSLGLVFAVGLVVILMSIFLSLDKKKHSQLYPLMLLTVACLLIGTIGSFSTFFGFVFPFIRAYCRICVFIAFFCAIAIGIMLKDFQAWLDKVFSRKSKCIPSIILSVVLVLITSMGLIDQTSSSFVPDYEAIKTSYQNDEEFVSDIISTCGEDNGATLYMVPYMSFPENGAIGSYQDYSPLLLAMHSRDIHLSYGSLRGTAEDNTLNAIGQSAIEDQISYARDNGYNGILLATNAYDQGTTTTIIENTTTSLGEPSARSSNYIFWVIGE